MKRIFSAFLAISMSMTVLGGCAAKSSGESSTGVPQVENAASTAESAGASGMNGIYDGIEPLKTPVELNIGYLSGSHHGVISYMIERMGGFEKAGIKPNIQVFGNGPVMVEALASDSWDCGTYGIGGTLTGIISQGTYVIGAAARDFDSLRIFARNDSDIIKAGKTLSDAPGLYGTADTWRGKEVFVTTGSTLHYVLSTGMEKFGLQDTDIKMTHMDVTSVNTALRANQGEVGALWGSFAYATDMSEKFTVAMSANDLGIELPTVMVANPRSYDDPAKYEAIKKWMELYFATANWINASEENFNKAAELFTEINEEVGVKSTLEENKTVLKNNKHYTLEENHQYFIEKSDDGKMLQIEKMNYDPLMFFISKGNYKPEDEKTFLGGYFKGDILQELYDQRK